MNISIAIIKINSISNIGSMNIGKTILCKNEASSNAYYPDSDKKLPPQQISPSIISPVAPTVPVEPPVILPSTQSPDIITPSFPAVP
ncbi:hypothetical protein [Paenibacillus abyssi]|uniref:Uncharacterized protein n=1 Tax=Paenibacillus abyssi TaxID=1340531 RepID=A0A917FVS2_9BACL|nr:hypothetical protein [Paenibacillus abyssi]GGG09880.1 hypothetical protein GCM10010916_28440 [Paenibacillus abyssi]